jgi:hypothetical protein
MHVDCLVCKGVGHIEVIRKKSNDIEALCDALEDVLETPPVETHIQQKNPTVEAIKQQMARGHAKGKRFKDAIK